MALKLNLEFAEWVEKTLAARGIKTLRQAEIKTGISHSSIKNMKDGRVPEETFVIRFAVAFSVSVSDALRLAGYDEMAEIWEKDHPDDMSALRDHKKEEAIDYNTDEPVDEEEGQVLAYFRKIPPMMRPQAKAVLKAFVSEDEDYEDGKVFGRKAE